MNLLMLTQFLLNSLLQQTGQTVKQLELFTTKPGLISINSLYSFSSDADHVGLLLVLNLPLIDSVLLLKGNLINLYPLDKLLNVMIMPMDAKEEVIMPYGLSYKMVLLLMLAILTISQPVHQHNNLVWILSLLLTAGVITHVLIILHGQLTKLVILILWVVLNKCNKLLCQL